MGRFFGSLAEIVAQPGPFLTCFLPIGDAEQIDDSRRAIAAADLSELERAFCVGLLPADGDEPGAAEPGAAEPRAAEPRVSETSDTAAMAVGVLAGSGTGYSLLYPEGPARPRIERGHVARIAPIVEAEQRLRHHLLVVVSDDGLDVMTFPRHGEPSLHRSQESDRDRQAHLVAEAVKATGTRFVLLAGSQAEVTELRDLVVPSVPIETVVETIPTPDLATPDAEWIADRAVAQVASDRARSTVDALRTWRFERAHGLGSSDVRDVVRALRSGSVRLLLACDDLDDRRQVWIGPDATDLASDLEDAGAIGGGSNGFVPVRLVDGLIRSALLQGVPIQIVPSVPDSSLPGGLGAVVDPTAELS